MCTMLLIARDADDKSTSRVAVHPTKQKRTDKDDPNSNHEPTTSMTARVTLTYPSGTHDKSNAFVRDPVLCSRFTARREIGHRCDDIRSG